MLPDERYVTVEDAARQIKVQPITLRRWLAIGTMPQFDLGHGVRAQSDVDAFNEACHAGTSARPQSGKPLRPRPTHRLPQVLTHLGQASMRGLSAHLKRS